MANEHTIILSTREMNLLHSLIGMYVDDLIEEQSILAEHLNQTPTNNLSEREEIKGHAQANREVLTEYRDLLDLFDTEEITPNKQTDE